MCGWGQEEGDGFYYDLLSTLLLSGYPSPPPHALCYTYCPSGLGWDIVFLVSSSSLLTTENYLSLFMQFLQVRLSEESLPAILLRKGASSNIISQMPTTSFILYGISI